MLIAGIVVAGIVGGIAAHGNYSDYDDEVHSQYGDARMRIKVKEAQAQLRKADEEVQRLKKGVQKQFDQCISDVQSEFHLPEDAIEKIKKRKEEYIAEPQQMGREIAGVLQKQLEESIESDRKRLKDIDALIKKINDMTLYDK